MGYSVYASVGYGIDLTAWIESGDIFSTDDWEEDNIPEFEFTNVSLESVWAEYNGRKIYLECEGWSVWSDDINARDFGESIGTGALPSPESIATMNANLKDAIAKIAKHYNTAAPSVEPGLVIKASFG
ncbi:MAG: hypothetical protein VX278_19035 [Myxococcota bacterium]|nr:hypothetical protein [Myxococcota bacterium]